MSFKIGGVILLVLLALTAQPLWAKGKVSPKMAKLETLNKPTNNQVNYKAYLKKSKNEIEGTASLLFLTYKSFFSSQDQASCVFTPSCSVYAIESLQHDNPFVAYLKIFDRLQRCHPLVKPGEYTIHKSTMNYYDPSF